MTNTSQRLIGLGAIALAIGFNVPFAILASIYAYPQVLRRSAGEALDLFAAGGPALILAWYGFMLSALALAILAPALAVNTARLDRSPALAIGAAVLGALAGLAQAIGLSRWVFAVPALARLHADPAGSAAQKLGAEQAFDLLNAWGGVAIGEHLGQVLTAVFVLQISVMQGGERGRISAPLGMLTAALLLVGSGEGVALSLGGSGETLALVTVIGFAALTLWLIATGVGLLRGQRADGIA